MSLYSKSSINLIVVTLKEFIMKKTNTSQLALYYFDSCPYCSKTRRSINKLNMDIELRNIERNHQHRIDLHQGGQKIQVPCLRIDDVNGDTQWLYESDDIIQYLAQY
jgi:glutaredoxin